MAPQKKVLRFLNVVIAVAAALTLLPAPLAHAAPEPPFEIRFPQDTSVTVFSSSFGAGRSGGRSHTGNDLMAPKMTPVYAAFDGVITVIDTSSLAGRYVEIDHGDGWSTRYIHLNNDDPGTDNGSADWDQTVLAGLIVGSKVFAGQQIAWVGDSGNAEWTGSHTHFEIAYEGREINPYEYLKAAFTRDQARLVDETWRIAHPGDHNGVA